MSLATVIRLEFAYPGVGVLAGDSLQYLSVATAHGVIMVFYMIMPAIFGAFGNFLLPTQLGVHDVAFPRLNSAAFWFLPGGVIMLFQLVCTDRRYARMNCFNIRELQGILKRKFFVDLLDSHDYRILLKESMINLRYKLNPNINLDFDTSGFYNFGLHLNTINKPFFFTSSTCTLEINKYDKFFLDYLMSFKPSNFFIQFFHYSHYMYRDIILIIFNLPFYINLLNILDLSFLKAILRNISINNIGILNMTFLDLTSLYSTTNKESSLSYTVNDSNVESENFLLNSYVESSSSQRFTRFSNPLINYDYKTGNYVGN